jgi:outer membrane lipoprotein SlyB
MRRTACYVVLMVSVAACSHPSSTTYDDTEVGQAIETAPGSVVSSRIVNVSDEPGVVGVSAGAGAGAAGGGLAVAGPAGLLVAIVGGVVGAAIGYMAEKQMKDRDGIEYVLKMHDGRLVTLVQNRDSDEQPLPHGARVLVQLHGQYARVVAHPEVDYNAGGGDWADPDSGGNAQMPSAGPGAAEPGGRNLPFHGSDVIERPGKPAPPLTSTTGSGQQR